MITALILLIVVAGILQYTYNKRLAENESEAVSGDPVFVDNGSGGGTPSQIYTEAFSDTNPTESDDITSAIAMSDGDENQEAKADTFALAKLNRQNARNESTDELRNLAEDSTADESVKNMAYQKIMDILTTAQMEEKLEEMLISSGYSDAMVYFGDEGSADVVVVNDQMDSLAATKIADIVSRQSGIPMDKVYVRNKF